MEKHISNFEKLWFDAMEIEGDRGWVFANNFNALFEINLKNQELTFLGSVPGETGLAQGLYFNLLKTGQKIILIPSAAKNIAIYDLMRDEFTVFPIDDERVTCFGGTLWKNKVFIVGNNTPYIYILDLHDNSLKKLDDCKRYFDKKKHVLDRMFFRKNSCVKGDVFYVASCVDNSIVQINMNTETVNIIELATNATGFRNITYGEGFFWITKWDECSLLKWDGIGNVCEEVFVNRQGTYKSSEIVVAGDRIYVFPTIGNHIYYYDVSCHSVQIDETIDKYIVKESCCPWGNQQITKVIKSKDEKVFWMFSYGSMSLLKYNYEQRCVEPTDLNISGMRLLSRLMGVEKTIKESDELTLKDFINGVF